MALAQKNTKRFENILELYGDLIYDICVNILWSSSLGQVAFKTTMKEIKHELKANPYFDYKRAFVLKIAYEKLGFAYQKNIKKLTPAEQIMLDTYLSLNDKINQFDSYFHRLPFADMFLLLIRDKHGLPYPEITAAMNTPEDSLKTQRQMAYRTLEEWIWETQ